MVKYLSGSYLGAYVPVYYPATDTRFQGPQDELNQLLIDEKSVQTRITQANSKISALALTWPFGVPNQIAYRDGQQRELDRIHFAISKVQQLVSDNAAAVARQQAIVLQANSASAPGLLTPEQQAALDRARSGAAPSTAKASPLAFAVPAGLLSVLAFLR